MPPPKHACMYARDIAEYSAEVVCNVMVSLTAFYLIFTAQLTHPFNGPFSRTTSGVLGGIRGYTAYTNLRVFLTAYTHLSDHK